jgi:hypothetical protein
MSTDDALLESSGLANMREPVGLREFPQTAAQACRTPRSF